MNTFAVLSHILPPAPSGQATVLYRLLQHLPADRYSLLTCMQDLPLPSHEMATGKLPGEYHHLKAVFRMPVPRISPLKEALILFNTFLGIGSRSLQVTAALKQGHHRLLIACSGDPCDLPAGYGAAVRTGTPFVPYIFDDYIHQWSGIHKTLARFFEPLIMKGAKGVIVTNEFMEQTYRDRYGIACTVIHNPCFLPSLEDLDRREKLLDPGHKHIVYTGAIYHAQMDSLLNLIHAVDLLERDDLVIDIFTSQSEASLRKEGLTGPMVQYHPHIPSSEVPVVLRQADILFLPLAFHSSIPEVIRTSSPGKTGEYLSVGRPILVHAPGDSFVSWFFRKHTCGRVVDEFDPRALSSAVQDLLNDRHPEMGVKARSTAEKEFDITLTSEKFRLLIDRLAQ